MSLNYNESISSSDSTETSLAAGSSNGDVGLMLQQYLGKGSDVSERNCIVQPEPSSESYQGSVDLDTYISPGRPLTIRMQAVPLAKWICQAVSMRSLGIDYLKEQVLETNRDRFKSARTHLAVCLPALLRSV
jgi:hypothetical protein